LLVRTDNVSLNLGGFQYNLTDAVNGSIVVGQEAGDVGSLTVTNGALASANTQLAPVAGSVGNFTVGNAGNLNNSGSLYVGGVAGLAGGTG